MSRFAFALLTLWFATAAGAQSVCSSDHQPQPVALVERFINADCDACWRDAKAPRAGRGELALDWIVPGARGDDAPLAMGASNDALRRLHALKRAVPGQSDSLRTAVVKSKHRLRVARGESFNDYVGASIELKAAGAGPWDAWLLLVEQLPEGAEGSPVPRNLVRNVFRPEWDRTPRKHEDARPMQIAEGAKPGRLQVVGLLYDKAGRLVAASVSACQ